MPESSDKNSTPCAYSESSLEVIRSWMKVHRSKLIVFFENEEAVDDKVAFLSLSRDESLDDLAAKLHKLTPSAFPADS